ncbi:MAG TPA: ABC transporter substrate-binding protein [Anaerolineales bacterium]|nr:ABC transporter substrate-binding protein [Anaerolineales bacterium]
MKRHLYVLFSLVILASFVLAACGSATPTQAPTMPPAATQAPAATEAPTAAMPAFQGMSVAAPDCNYGTADNPAEFKSIEAVDQYTVKFTLCHPDPAFLSKVAFDVFAIQSKNFLDANGGDSVKMSQTTNGTGPYMLKEWVQGDHITLVANPNYWGDKPHQATLIFRWSDQSAQRLLELQSGTVDGIDNPAPEDYATIQGDTNLKLYPREALNVFYIGFDHNIKPFDDVNVRQAFAMAIDRQHIVDLFYPANSTTADTFVPPSFNPGYTQGFKWYDYNPDQAKKMLTDAKFDFSQTITLSYRNVTRPYLPSPDKVAQEVAAELAKIGVKVKVNEEESTTFLDNTSAGKEGFYMLGWGVDYPDSTDFYDYHFANASNAQFGDLYPDLAAAIRAGAQVADPVARQADYDKVNQLIKDLVPMIPVAHGASAVAYKASVKGAYASPLGDEGFAAMDNGSDTFVFMQNGEPGALWCADETDGEALRVCHQLYDGLMAYEPGGVKVVPGLAESYDVNADASEWTFHLRQGIKFSNGDELSANDVVATFAAQWDASSPNHKGRTGTFDYFGAFFGAMLNAPKQ